MFTELYLDSTDPRLPLSGLFAPKILVPMIVSILVHVIGYTLFIDLISWIFFGKILSTVVHVRLVSSLLLLMFFGFIGRLIHVKDIYAAYHGNMENTREYVNKHYISWVFHS